MQAYITINTVAEFSCFVVSLLCLYKDKDPVWRVLILFLFFTCLVEFGGIFIRNVLMRPNYMIYNIFLVPECIVQSYFFYHLYKIYHNRKNLLIIWVILFLIVYFGELVSNHFSGYAFRTSTVVAVELILASIYYYYLVLKENQYRRLSVYAPFWWVNGTICFYFASTASNMFFNYLVVIDRAPVMSYSVRYIVFNILNVILYLSWSYSFLCRYRQRTSFSSSD